MSALPAFKEPDVISATPDEVLDVLASGSSWDSDNHGPMWWTIRVEDGGFFERLDSYDHHAILMAIARDTSSYTADMRRRLRAAIEQEIAT